MTTKIVMSQNRSPWLLQIQQKAALSGAAIMMHLWEHGLCIFQSTQSNIKWFWSNFVIPSFVTRPVNSTQAGDDCLNSRFNCFPHENQIPANSHALCYSWRVNTSTSHILDNFPQFRRSDNANCGMDSWFWRLLSWAQSSAHLWLS